MRHPQAPRSPELAIELLPGALLHLVLHVRLWEKPWISKLLTWGRSKMERKRRQDHDPRIPKKQHQRLMNPGSSRKTSKRFFLSILWCTHSILHLESRWLFMQSDACFLSCFLMVIRLRDKGQKARELALDLNQLKIPHQQVGSTNGIMPCEVFSLTLGLIWSHLCGKAMAKSLEKHHTFFRDLVQRRFPHCGKVMLNHVGTTCWITVSAGWKTVCSKRKALNTSTNWKTRSRVKLRHDLKSHLSK